MKNIIYFLILTLWVGIATSVFAQNYNCVGEVRTTTPTVNIWDWRQPTYPVFIKNDQNTPGLRDTLRSPFETGQFSYNENTAHLAMPLIKDYDPADGWELVYKSFGTGTSSINAVIAPAYTGYRVMLNEDSNFLINNQWEEWRNGWHTINKTNDSITIEGYYYKDEPKNSIKIKFKGKRL